MAKGPGILNYIRILLICMHFTIQNGASYPDDAESKLSASESSVVSAQNTSVKDGMFRATLPFVTKHLGMIECEGAERAGDFIDQIFGNEINFNRSNYLCGPTCQGKCVRKPNDVGLPPSIYPFGCSCETNGCNEDGPIIAPLIKPTFKIVCRQDTHCTCLGMGPGQFTGYSCLWMNERTKLPVTYKEEQDLPKTKGPIKPAKFFPLRWCSCCPRIPIMRSDWWSWD